MPTHELEVTVSAEQGATVLGLTGTIDSSAEAALDAGYEEAAASDGAIVLDFTAADYINSSGIALIVRLLGQARSRGAEVRARGLSAHYREIFEITRLSDFMTIENGAGDGETDSGKDGGNA